MTLIDTVVKKLNKKVILTLVICAVIGGLVMAISNGLITLEPMIFAEIHAVIIGAEFLLKIIRS